MGNCIQNLAAGISLVAADNTWIEGNAIQQLQTTFRLEGMQRVVGMPDLHPGRGYPVGAAFFSAGRLYPALIGNDIGCGMSLWQTDLDAGRVNPDKLVKRLGNIDGPLDDSGQEQIAELALPPSGFEASLGTIGGGNHFAELQHIDTVYNADVLPLQPKRLLLLVHSGSRGLGQLILRQHVDRFGHHGLMPDSDDCREYLQQHATALRFAKANRYLIALRMLERLRAEGQQLLDVNHNLLQPATIDGVDGWLHRKGASPADAGPVVIAGSRGDYSYLVLPHADPRSLQSVAHGAGRKWMRSECKDRLAARYSVAQLARTSLGSRVVCQDRALIYEEAPEAYKPVASIIEALQGAGLVTPLARLRPVLTYKTAGECCA